MRRAEPQTGADRRHDRPPWPALLAVALALATLGVGLTWATTAASGADAHGYVSQADGWRAGRLTVDQSWASDAPWRMARWTLTPLGYRPSNVDGRAWDIVPSYPPGLPLLMAGAKAVAGQEGLFWIVPISGAVLVLATFAITRHLLGAGAALTAAWLLATSPAMLFMLMLPMSDVPAAATWAVAWWALLDDRVSRAAGAGLAAGLAIMIRPNLAPVAIVLLGWIVVRGAGRRGRTFRQTAAFLPGVAVGALAVAAVNTTLNGAPWISGYGSIGEAFRWSHVWPNAVGYLTWLGDTQTPLAVVGLMAALLPLRVIWPRHIPNAALWAMSATVAVVWASYLLYTPYDAWWFLRFLLPSWPFVSAGAAAVLALVGGRSRRAQWLVAAAVLGIGAWQIHVASDRGVFRLWQDERRAVTVARAVDGATPGTAVIFSRQHSGSVRYYAGRLTVRFEEFEPGDVDRAVAWFAGRGRPSYLLVDEVEVPMARAAFAGQDALDRLSDPPVFHYSGATEVYLYRLDAPIGPRAPTRTVRETWANTRSVAPPLRTFSILPP